MTQTLSIIVPCFNEEAVIRLTHRQIIEDLGSLPDTVLEIVYVNDGSSDSTEAILEALAAQDARVCVVQFSRNFGHQAAVSAGIDFATGDAVAIIDADLQDPPKIIADMLPQLRAGAEVIYGVRRDRKEGMFKKICYSAFYRIWSQLAQISVPKDSGDFCLMDRKVADAIRALPERNRFLRGLRAWVGFTQAPHYYDRAARRAGETKYPFWKLVKLAMDGIFNFSLAPLQFITTFGIATSALAFVSLLFVLIQRIAGFSILGVEPSDVPGYTSLMLVLCVIGGVQLLALGTIGEYIGRIYTEAKGRPTYVVKRTLGTVSDQAHKGIN